MSGILFKDESGKAKQSIPPKTWTYVKFQGKDKFVVPETGVWEWTVVLRVEYPAGAGGHILLTVTLRCLLVFGCGITVLHL